MRAGLKKYTTLTRAGMIEALQFRLSFIMIAVGNVLYLIVVYYLWKSIYASAGTDVVSGMTFTEVQEALQPVGANLGMDIHMQRMDIFDAMHRI